MSDPNKYSFRIIVTRADGSIYDIWEHEFRWRKDGLSQTLCDGVAHAMAVLPEGGKIQIAPLEKTKPTYRKHRMKGSSLKDGIHPWKGE